jgi:hypothetical protein
MEERKKKKSEMGYLCLDLTSTRMDRWIFRFHVNYLVLCALQNDREELRCSDQWWVKGWGVKRKLE